MRKLYGGFILPVCPSSSAELLSQYYLVSETFCDTHSLRGTYVLLFCGVRMTIESDRKINYWIQGLNTRESSNSAKDRDLLGCSLRYCLHTSFTNPKTNILTFPLSISCHWSLYILPENIIKPLVFWYMVGYRKRLMA